MKNEKTFDRSVCFTVFRSHYDTAKDIEDIYGLDDVGRYFLQMAEYALFDKEPEFDKKDPLKLLWSSTKATIDANVKRRKSGFREDTDITDKILEYKQSNPNATQREIAAQVGCSIGKVNKTLKKEASFSSSDNSYTSCNNNDNGTCNSNSNSNSNSNEREREQECSLIVANAPTESSTPTLQTLTFEEYTSVMNIWEERSGKSPYQIAKELNLDSKLVIEAVNEFKENGFVRRKKPVIVIEEIPLADGGFLNKSKEELFNIATDYGQKLVDEVDWIQVQQDYALYGISYYETMKLINEFKERLEELSSFD